MTWSGTWEKRGKERKRVKETERERERERERASEREAGGKEEGREGRKGGGAGAGALVCWWTLRWTETHRELCPPNHFGRHVTKGIQFLDWVVENGLGRSWVLLFGVAGHRHQLKTHDCSFMSFINPAIGPKTYLDAHWLQFNIKNRDKTSNKHKTTRTPAISNIKSPTLQSRWPAACRPLALTPQTKERERASPTVAPEQFASGKTSRVEEKRVCGNTIFCSRTPWKVVGEH